MTLYWWWTHWFWITSIIVIFLSAKYIEAYPLSPLLETNTKEYNHNSNNKRREDIILTQFPLNDDELDIEDIFNGRDSIPGAISLTAKSDSTNRSSNSEIAPTHESVIQKMPPRQVIKNNSTFPNNKNINNEGNSYSKSTNVSATFKNITLSTSTTPEMDSVVNDTDKFIGAIMDEKTVNTTGEGITESDIDDMTTSTAMLMNNSESELNRFDDIKVFNDADKIIMTSTTSSSGGSNSSNSSNNNNRTSNNSNSNISVSRSTLSPSVVDIIDKNSTPHKAPFTLENVNKEDELIRAENEHRSRKSKVLSAEYRHENNFINFSSDAKNLLARSPSSSLEFDESSDDGNVSSEALSIQRAYFLDAGTISGICLAVLAVCSAISFAGVVLYRRRYLNKPQTLSEPDSSVYIDDSTIRDNSDEMYSLDNDSFLNSLEAMTIQNYWTDTVKHTKL